MRGPGHADPAGRADRQDTGGVRREFVPDSPTPGAGGRSIPSVDGQKVAEEQVPRTQVFVFSADDGADVGSVGETNVSTDYPRGNNAFTGRIVKVTVEQL